MSYRAIKKKVKEVLLQDDYEGLAALLEEHPRALSAILSLTYDKETVLTWKAIKSMGPIVWRITEKSYDDGRNIVRRLVWSITEESGGIGWSALEMLGEIVKHCPEKFDDIILIITGYYEEEIFRPGVLYALARIAERSPELPGDIGGLLSEALRDRDPYVRAFALLAMKAGVKNGAAELPEAVNESRSDGAEVKLYDNGEMKVQSIGELAEALQQVQSS